MHRNHITEEEAMEGLQFAIVFVTWMSALAMLFIIGAAK